MKKVIYSLLIATSIIQTAVYAGDKPLRPSTPTPTGHAKLSPEVCTDVLDMKQLSELRDTGKLKLNGHEFKLHTSKTDFDAMLPSKWQLVSKGTSIAHIQEAIGKATVSTPQGPIVKCSYTFRTALGSKVFHKDPKPFSIVSEPQEGKPLPEGFVEALRAHESSKVD